MSEPEPQLLKTKEVLDRAGISRQVLYRYMQLDLVVPAHVTKSGRHEFSPKVFKIIEMIELLQKSGYTLRDIKDLVGRRMASAQKPADAPGDDPAGAPSDEESEAGAGAGA